MSHAKTVDPRPAAKAADAVQAMRLAREATIDLEKTFTDPEQGWPAVVILPPGPRTSFDEPLPLDEDWKEDRKQSFPFFTVQALVAAKVDAAGIVLNGYISEQAITDPAAPLNEHRFGPDPNFAYVNPIYPDDSCEVVIAVGVDRQRVLMELAYVEGFDDRPPRLTEWQPCPEIAARLDCIFLDAVKFGLWAHSDDPVNEWPQLRPDAPPEFVRSPDYDAPRHQTILPRTREEECWPEALGVISLGEALGLDFMAWPSDKSEPDLAFEGHWPLSSVLQ